MVQGTIHATKFGLGPSVSHLPQDHFQAFLPICTAFGVARLVSNLATVQRPEFGSRKKHAESESI